MRQMSSGRAFLQIRDTGHSVLSANCLLREPISRKLFVLFLKLLLSLASFRKMSFSV